MPVYTKGSGNTISLFCEQNEPVIYSVTIISNFTKRFFTAQI